LYITYALNKFINIEINFAKSVFSILFKMFEISDALFTFTLLIIYLTSFSEMCKLNDIVKNINKFVMLLMFI